MFRTYRSLARITRPLAALPKLLEGACSESVSKDDELLSGHGAVPGVRDIEFTNDD